MELTHCLPCIDVVVGGVAMGGELQTTTGYVGAEGARLDAGEVNVPAGFYFLGNGFGEAFDGPFGGAVDGERGNAVGR